MIVFVSLFLGLVTGSQIVEVAVSGQVAAVELRLDGEPVDRLDGEPWKTEVDFGAELTTHELVAVARDRLGNEVGRAVQLLNVPRSPNEAEILLGGWQAGRPGYARLILRSRELLQPESIAVSLDGTALEIEDPSHIELPPLDPQQMHFISAELTFPFNLRSTAQAIFGGRYGEQVESELTAVPLELRGRRLERPEDGRDWLRRRGGGALRVVAVEDDPAKVFIVRDEAALPTLSRLYETLKFEKGRANKRLGLVAEDRLFLISPRALVTPHPEVDYELYPISRAFGLEEASLLEALARFTLGKEGTTAQRLSDAVAVAGVRAAAGGKRRAVLLIVKECDKQSGHWNGASVRRYLAELRVPLEVWATGPPGRKKTGFCRAARHLINTDSYLRALYRLRRLLARQQILWVEGSHLPREIVLADAAPAKEVVQLN